MTEKKFTFSDFHLTKIKNDTSKRVIFFDTKQPGLALRVTASNTKTFCFMAWDSARNRSVDVSLGRYPKVSLADGRRLAQELAKKCVRLLTSFARPHGALTPCGLCQTRDPGGDR